MATYALNLDTDGRILSISQYFQEIPAGVTTVDTIPDGNCGDWLYKNGVYVYDPIINLPVEKAAKHNIISNTCANTIESGIDVTTSVGKEHFSLTTKDQLDLTNQVAIAKSGSATVYYHADGALCRAFTAEEIISVGTAAIAYVTYNTSLANHLFAWIDRCTTKDELNKITYSPDDLPEDLFANFAKITGYTKPVVTETPTETTTTPNTAVDTTTTNTTTPDTTTTDTSSAESGT